VEQSNSEKTAATRNMPKKTCTAGAVQAHLLNAPGETRTPNLLIRSQMLYPIELRAPISTLVLFDEIRIGPEPDAGCSVLRMLRSPDAPFSGCSFYYMMSGTRL
jgi:hypothetical protein